MSDPKGYYQTLGLSSNASQNDIRKAYLKLAQLNHPDKVHDPIENENAHKKFVKIGQAYEVLSDPNKRKEYDSTNTFHPFFKDDFFNMNPFGGHNDAFAHFDKIFKTHMNFSNDITHFVSSTSKSQSTKIINGKKTTVIKEVVNDNGKITETITNIDENGKKTKQIYTSDQTTTIEDNKKMIH